MQSGQLKNMIMRTYDVTKNQAESLMDIIEMISYNYKMSFLKGVAHVYREHNVEDRDENRSDIQQ